MRVLGIDPRSAKPSLQPKEQIFILFKDRISLYSLFWSRTQSVDQDDLKLWDLLASATQVLGLKVCVTTPGLGADF